MHRSFARRAAFVKGRPTLLQIFEALPQVEKQLACAPGADLSGIGNERLKWTHLDPQNSRFGQLRQLVPHSVFRPFLAFIDSRNRSLWPFISKMWQRCVIRSSNAAVIRSPWNTWPQSPNARLLVISRLARS
jgi:hypothetical protein